MVVIILDEMEFVYNPFVVRVPVPLAALSVILFKFATVLYSSVLNRIMSVRIVQPVIV